MERMLCAIMCAMEPSKTAVESVLADLPGNVTEQERNYLLVLKDYIETGDETAVRAIPEKALKLLRVKCSAWQGPRFKSSSAQPLPPQQQLLSAMDSRIRQFESSADRNEKLAYFVAGAFVGLWPTIIEWLSS